MTLEADAAASVFAPGMPIAAAVRAASRLFARAGLETPDLDARILIAHILGIDRRDFILAPDRPVGAAAPALGRAVSRRLAREPVARIIGEWEFWGLPFALGPATLVPRPDTETIVAAALAMVRNGGNRRSAPRILDLGTGSGVILVALLHELDGAFGVGIDLSPAAAALARRNAARNDVAGRAGFVAGNWAGAVVGPFDLVVANPPYVARADIARLDPDVQHYDPAPALDGGVDGLDAYRAIIPDLPRLLAPGGAAVVEAGAGQADAVAALFAAAGLEPAGVRLDLNGTTRAVLARASR